jgi:hypothetical protein
MFRPRREEPKLTIITVIRQPHFWADEKYLLVVNDDTAVVNHVLVHYGPSRIHSGYCTVQTNPGTHIPMSHTISIVTSDARILAKTSQEWRTVSPEYYLCRRNLRNLRTCLPSRK